MERTQAAVGSMSLLASGNSNSGRGEQEFFLFGVHAFASVREVLEVHFKNLCGVQLQQMLMIADGQQRSKDLLFLFSTDKCL